MQNERRTNYFILCGGEAERWGNYMETPKHFVVPLNDREPILHRTVKLLKKEDPTAVINIVARPQDLGSVFYTKLKEEHPSVNLVEANLTPENGGADKMLSSAHLWKQEERTVLMNGDVFYTEKALQAITRQSTGEDGWWQVCNFDKNPWTGGGFEIFAHIIDPHGYATYLESLQQITELYKAGAIKRNQMWEQYASLCGKQGKEIYPYENVLSQPNITRGKNYTEVVDGTEDFDYHKHLTVWVESYRRADPAKRKIMTEGLEPVSSFYVKKAGEKLRILFYTPRWLPMMWGGSLTYNHDLALELIKAGHTVHAEPFDRKRFAAEYLTRYEWEGVVVNPSTEEKGGYDIIITHTLSLANAWKLKQTDPQLKNTPLVGIVHNERPDNIVLCHRPEWDGILFNSSWIGKLVDNQKAKRSTLIPITYPPLKPEQVDPAAKNKIIMINSNPTKGGPLMREIVALAVEQAPELEFIHVRGWWGEQEELSRFPNVKQYEGLNAQEVDELLKEACIHLLPSNLESWSITAQQSQGKGNIVFYVDNMPALVENLSDSGVVLPVQATAADWLKKIVEVKEAYHEENSTLHLKALERAEMNHDRHATELNEAVKFVEAIAGGN